MALESIIKNLLRTYTRKHIDKWLQRYPVISVFVDTPIESIPDETLDTLIGLLYRGGIIGITDDLREKLKDKGIALSKETTVLYLMPRSEVFDTIINDVVETLMKEHGVEFLKT